MTLLTGLALWVRHDLRSTPLDFQGGKKSQFSQMISQCSSASVFGKFFLCKAPQVEAVHLIMVRWAGPSVNSAPASAPHFSQFLWDVNIRGGTSWKWAPCPCASGELAEQTRCVLSPQLAPFTWLLLWLTMGCSTHNH